MISPKIQPICTILVSKEPIQQELKNFVRTNRFHISKNLRMNKLFNWKIKMCKKALRILILLISRTSYEQIKTLQKLMIIQNKNKIRRIQLQSIRIFINTYPRETFKKNQSKLKNNSH